MLTDQDIIRVVGCTAVYANGVLEIYENIKTLKAHYHGRPVVSWIVVGVDGDLVRISPDGVTISVINKNLCRIV